MDISPPQSPTLDPVEDFAASGLFARMLDDLAEALQPRGTDTPSRASQRSEDARAMVIAAHPRDPIEAALAITAAIAYQASLATNAPDAVPSASLARTALAQQRTFQSGIAALDKHRAPAGRASARRASELSPDDESEAGRITDIPRLPQFQPRDRYGEPIKLHRFQDMTKKQVDATYGDPFSTALWEAAIEEEEIAIAAQKATDEAAQSQPT